MISVITPIKNSAQLILKHYEEVATVLEDRAAGFEIIYIDDGSNDESVAIISELARTDSRIRGFALDTSYGQQVAIIVGKRAARGHFFVTLDVDLEVPADVIPRFIDALENGADFVAGARINRRRQPFTRRIGSLAFGLLMRIKTQVPVHDFGCGATAFRRSLFQRVMDSQVPYHGLKELYAKLADECVNVPIAECCREGHRSSYGIKELYRALRVEHARTVGVSTPPTLRATEIAPSEHVA